MLVTLTAAGCFLLALVGAHPHHLQQVYYPPPGSFYYVPQADAASVTSVQRYAAPLPVPVAPGAPQYVLLYPGGPQHNFLHGRDDGVAPATERPTIWNLFNIFQRPTTTAATPVVEDAVTEAVTAPTPTKAAPAVTTTTVATTVEETTPKPVNEVPAKPEKIVDEDEMMMAVEQASPGMTDEEKASLENLDETVQPAGSPSPDGRQFVVVQQPQFFGNYDLLRQRDMQQSLGIPPGAVSNFLLFRNGFVKPGVVGRPLKMEAEGEPVPVPGAAALAFQQEMRRRDAAVMSRGSLIPGSHHVDLSHMAAAPAGFLHVGPAHQNVYLLGAPKGVATVPVQAVVVDAERPKKDASELEQTGPSVAQAKPQAIALAGVGGMAAAAPVATAVVGPGGLAVAAPTATAVAGTSAGGSLVGPAQAAITAANKHINKVNKLKVKDSAH